MSAEASANVAGATRHFLRLADQTAADTRRMLERAFTLRDAALPEAAEPPLAGRSVAMLFEKPSLRTRVSYEVGIRELGGQAVVLGQHEVGLGQRESVADVARVLGGMVDAIAARVFDHGTLETFAAHSGVPVINMLSDRYHPSQAIADAMTLMDEWGCEPSDLAGRRVAFVGDGNNVAVSLAWACKHLGMSFVLACPAGFEPPPGDLPGDGIEIVHATEAAVKDADAVFCDTFVSMGQEAEKQERLATFAGYQVNDALLAHAKPEAVVLHCLPAYRGVEITDAVMDGPRSRVFPEAWNRLHAQKGMLADLLAGS